MRKCTNISPYLRRPCSLIWLFIWSLRISLYTRKIVFSFYQCRISRWFFKQISRGTLYYVLPIRILFFLLNFHFADSNWQVSQFYGMSKGTVVGQSSAPCLHYCIVHIQYSTAAYQSVLPKLTKILATLLRDRLQITIVWKKTDWHDGLVPIFFLSFFFTWFLFFGVMSCYIFYNSMDERT